MLCNICGEQEAVFGRRCLRCKKKINKLRRRELRKNKPRNRCPKCQIVMRWKATNCHACSNLHCVTVGCDEQRTMFSPRCFVCWRSRFVEKLPKNVKTISEIRRYVKSLDLSDAEAAKFLRTHVRNARIFLGG
jgi:DNA-directed RNA polymerase subunit RPC12/RpoP